MRTLLSVFLMTFLACQSILAQEATKKFRDENKEVTIEMPKSWNLKTTDDGKTYQLIVSKELLLKETDKFTVGVTVTKIRRISKTLTNITTDADIVKTWKESLNKQAETYFKSEIVKEGRYATGSYQGIINEIRFQQTEKDYIVHVYQVILAYNDDLLMIVFESPDNVWKNYKSVMENGLMSLYVKE